MITFYMFYRRGYESADWIPILSPLDQQQGGEDGNGGGDGGDGIMSDICHLNCSLLGKVVIDKLAGERRGVDLCQSQGNT